MHVLVTGGAGFIGSQLCEALIARGERVTALDNFDAFYPRAMKERNLQWLRGQPGFRLVEGDVRSEADLDTAFGPDAPEVVVHLAALAGVRPSLIDPWRYQDVNVGGTTRVLEAMRRHRVQKLILGSSSSVYGNSQLLPFAEDDPVGTPISPYAATKRAAELMAHAYHHLYGISVYCLRFFTVYGPRQRPDLAIHTFARRMLAGQPVPVFGDGQSRRDYTYIDDILQGVLHAIDRVRGYRIYNLGERQTTSILELIAHLEAALGQKAHLEFRPPQAGDVIQTWAEISRARAELDYRPQVPVSEGIPRFVRWLLDGLADEPPGAYPP